MQARESAVYGRGGQVVQISLPLEAAPKFTPITPALDGRELYNPLQLPTDTAKSVMGVEARLAQLEAERSRIMAEGAIAEYDALTTRPADEPLVFSLDSIEALPLALIKARIAAKLSQKELAERLGLKEQQIQRYEATEYASANMARVIEVSQALGVKLQSCGMIGQAIATSINYAN